MTIDQNQLIATLQNYHLFEKLDAQALEALAEHADVVHIQKNQVIYRQGAEASCLFIILSGRVRVFRQNSNKSQKQLAVLVPGDFLGVEVASQTRRMNRTVAASEATLLRLDRNALDDLFRQTPQLRAYLNVANRTQKLSRKANHRFLRPDEAVYFMARRHWIFLAHKVFLPFLLLLMSGLFSIYASAAEFSIVAAIGAGLVAGVSLLWIFWNTYDWLNDFYMMTNQRIIWLEKVAIFYDSRQEAPLSTILSVGVSTGQIGRWIGFGDVIIRSYTGTVIFRGVNHPEHVRSQIEEHWFRAKDTHRQEETFAIEQAIRQRLGLQGDPTQPPVHQPEVKRSSNLPMISKIFPAWLSHLFHLRFEEDSVITYRKHWFILLGRCWKPALFILIIAIMTLTRLMGWITVLSVPIFLLVSVLLMVGISLWLLYEYLDWHNDIFQVTLDQVIDIERKPLGREERKAAPLENILSINYERLGLVGLLFNFGTVFISVGNTQLTFDHVFNPSQVQEDIFNHLADRLARKKHEDILEERDRVADWFAAYHENIRLAQGQLSQPDFSNFSEN
jgi:CRP-like cAMP-binding protein